MFSWNFVLSSTFIIIILLIILKALKFTSPVLFGTHILLDRSSIVMQDPLHLSKLTANG